MDTEGADLAVKSVSHDDRARVLETPLPRLQLAALCLISMNEGFQINLIWPFLPFMVSFFRGEENKGTYVGLLATSFFIAQFFSSLYWGRLADKFGRRPTLLLGLVGALIATSVFAFASSYEMALLGRIFSGALNGGVGITKCYLGEICDRSNQARGFSYLSMMWGVASVSGPICGGFFAEPAKQWPRVFNTPFWVAHPYLLPCVPAMALTCCAFFTGLFFLPETEAWKSRQANYKRLGEESGKGLDAEQGKGEYSSFGQRRDPTEDSEGVYQEDLSLDDLRKQKAEQEQSQQDELNDPNKAKPSWCCCWNSIPLQLRDVGVIMAVVLYGLVSAAHVIYDELFPLFCQEERSKGGLGFSTDQIGAALAIQGTATFIFQVLIYPRVAARIRPSTMFWVAMLLHVPYFALFPTLNQIPASNSVLLWGVLACCKTYKTVLGACAFTSVFLLLNNSATAVSRGTVTGVGQAASSLGRAIAPLSTGAIWSWSLLQTFPLHMYIAHIVGASVALLAALVGFRAPASLNSLKH